VGLFIEEFGTQSITQFSYLLTSPKIVLLFFYSYMHPMY